MSATETIPLSVVSSLIEQFNEYEKIFEPVFLQYNGKTEVITLQYRLRTQKTFKDEEKFLKKFLSQYLNNPIEIPSELYSVQINDQNSIENLALNKKFFVRVADYNIFHISNLLELDSEYINILIDSKFKIDLGYLISSNISHQPKIIGKNILQFELISLLKTNIFPDKFQCLNIPVSYELNLNDFIEYYIPKKFLIASEKWYKMERFEGGSFRKKRQYAVMLKQKFGISPLEFNRRIQLVLEGLLYHIQKKYSNVIEIKNIKGILNPKIPKGYHRAENPGILSIRFKFETNFDNESCITQAHLIFDFKWMRNIFKKYFSI